MRRASCFVFLFLLPLGCGGMGPDAADTAGKTNKSDKGGEVELDGMRSQPPAEWKQEPPSSSMRMAQFRLPKQAGDDRDAELVIFQGLRGSAKQNVERWKGQMEPPEGKKIDDVAKVKEFKVGEADVTYLDVQGTFFNAMPGTPKNEAEKQPGSRMLAVQLEGKHKIYHIKLTGPAKTVEHYKPGFDKWLESFK